MNETGGSLPVLRVAAVVGWVVGVFLLLGSWDGLYDELDLPQALPALSAQIGGASLVALAYLLWAASSAAPELSRVAAVTGLIADGGAAVIVAAWLIFRDPTADLRIDTQGTVILIVLAVIFALLAIGLARVALVAGRGAR